MSRFGNPLARALDPELPQCPSSHKFAFKSRRAVRAQMHRWQGRGGTFHGQYVYRCRHCPGWHITSQARP